MSTENDNTVNSSSSEEIIFDSSETQFHSWDELDLNPSILRGIFAYGFEKPSPIQQRAIKPIMEGRDVIAQAQSGTGKTATFAIGALQRVNITDHSTQVLILSPTRELSKQTAKVVSNLGSFMNGLKIQTLFGGSLIEEGSCFSNKNTPHIICGCTGPVSYTHLTLPTKA